MEQVVEEKGIIQVQEQRGRGGGGGGIIKQIQNLNHHQQQNQQNHPPPPPAQPQKCPRCDSLNTKFCYYNNYSLSQPRYFCKTCRRYWTQGGTLRNVPVGGGCRKGKRMKKSSSSSSSSDTSGNQGITSATPISVDSSRYNKPIDTISSSLQPTVPPFAFPGGGFLSSLSGIQSFNAEFGGSNLALLQGFAHPSFLHQHHQQQQLQFDEKPTLVFNMGSREALEENVIQATSHHQEWPQSFNNSSSSTMITSEQSAGFWSNNTTNTTTNNNTTTTSGAGSSLNLNQTHHWVDLPGFGAPPPTSSSSPSFL